MHAVQSLLVAPEVSVHEENMHEPVEFENWNLHCSGLLLLMLVAGHVLLAIWMKIRRITVWSGSIILLYNSYLGTDVT